MLNQANYETAKNQLKQRKHLKILKLQKNLKYWSFFLEVQIWK